MEDKLFKNLTEIIKLANTWTETLSASKELTNCIWNLVELVKPVKDEVAKKLIAKLDDLMKEVEQATINLKNEIEKQ